ncbi:competence protein ComEC [Dysgonomonadaceae bacterium PH5-43]|nr:competence protein ComEC [Dysgonomonadaceae bacterium PH5-43]
MIFLRLLPFLVFGILLQTYYDVTPLLYFSLGLGVSFTVISFMPFVKTQYKLRFVSVVGISLILFSLGIYIMNVSAKNVEWNNVDGVGVYEVQLIDIPIKKPKTYQCKLKVLKAEQSNHSSINKHIIAYIPIDSISQALNIGDHLLLCSQFADAPHYLKTKSVSAVGLVNKQAWHKVKEASFASLELTLKMLVVKQKLLIKLRDVIPDSKHYAIASALMFGYKGDLDQESRQAFANIGAGHILAVSGLHFSIIFGILYFILSFIGNSLLKRIIRQLILLPLVWAFALMLGMPPSVIRAASMFTVVGIGNVFFYKSFSINTLAFVAFFMLFSNPFYLYDVGFQLSFLAVLSILIINPYIEKLYKTQNKILGYFWSLISVSFSAQIGVLPLSIYYFNQFPLIFLITNICIIPLATVLLIMIPVSLLFHSLFQTSFVSIILNKLLNLFVDVICFLDNLPFRSIDNISISLFDLFLVYILMINIALIFIKKKIVYVYSSIIIVIFLLIYYLCSH